MRRMSVPLILTAVLAGCGAERAPQQVGAPEPAGAQAPASAPAPASPSTSTSTPAPPSRPAPPPSPAPDGDLNLARFTGYGDIPFGTPVADMARLWGGELRTSGKDFNDRCYFMTPIWSKRPADFNFMISEGRFARFSTDSRNFLAPGGAHVGMTRAEIVRRYAGQIEVQPHHYTDGQYLRVKDPEGGNGVLLMETDGKGDDARVTEWRVGVPPEVDYVEGCS